MTKGLRTLVLVLSATYMGWKMGQKDKEKEIAGEEPCMVDVGGVMKPVPRAICDTLAASKSMLNIGSDTGPYGA